MSPNNKHFTFTIPKNDNTMVLFDSIIKPVDRSSAIRAVLQYVISQDPNFLRRLIGIPEVIESIVPPFLD